ncbi:Protein detoxification 46, chloroplastic [Vitis vinifera]|uniref:Protein detoxification 46, chloroplastic n=1 Tax=Vitis vinifera TaxID=29760 RepID=A0A438I9G5_VITVI|nr:Protein detoxification 46, chloroplastic [Vitis vinifera]
MPFKALSHASHFHLQNPDLRRFSPPSTSFSNSPNTRFRNSPAPSLLRISPAANDRRHRLTALCKSSSQEVLGETQDVASENGGNGALVSSFEEEDVGEGEEEAVEVVVGSKRKEFAADQSILNQMKKIVMFSGPATALWICGPLMSLIDTAVIGQGSSLELAALGPGTVLCDNMSYVFMFLSIATSNMVATALARKAMDPALNWVMALGLMPGSNQSCELGMIGFCWQDNQFMALALAVHANVSFGTTWSSSLAVDKKEVQHQISILLFIGLACGVLMLFFMKFLGAWALTAFTGPKNAHLVPAANTYVQIRGLAWPAVLIGWVAQSASLGMKDSWGPLKALAVASAVNVTGHVVLCTLLGYGIAGAAWATMVSQVIAAYMMIEALNKKGFKAYSISVPSPSELLQIFKLAAPVFVTMVSKVSFYSLIIYFATSMGTHTVAAHQVMIQMYSMCVVWGEPLSQTAQSFMPELMYGVDRSLSKAQTLLKSLLIIGVILGLLLGIVGTSVPALFPNIFTPDPSVMQQMHKVLIPFFFALAVTPCTHSLEGTLLAGRDLKFLSLSMSGCFTLGAIILWLVSNSGYGLPGCWCALVGFQWARFFLSLRRLLSPNGVLFSEERYELGKLKAA